MSSASPSKPEPPATAGTPGPAIVRFAVGGMHCSSCTALIEESLVDHPGVASASVDLDSGEAVVRFDPAEVGVDQLAAVIAEAGYTAAAVC